jgi:hypothetical protein
MPEGTAPSSVVAHLDNTVTARWRRRIVGLHGDERQHWMTKRAYYRAVDDLLTTNGPAPLTWRTVVDAVRPKGSRSTFYVVIGPNARQPLLRSLIHDGALGSIQLALCYQHPAVCDHLVDETKVWSYWPSRELLLAQYRRLGEVSVPTAAGLIAAAVEDWARRSPHLAAALDHTPPICAVEDLMAIHGGRLPAVRAIATLTQAMRHANTLSAAARAPA